MSINNKITQLYRASGGTKGAPGGTKGAPQVGDFSPPLDDADKGLLAVNFADDPKIPGIYVYEGLIDGWKRLNGKADLTTIDLTVGPSTGVANIGKAWFVSGKILPTGVVIAQHGTPKVSYILVDRSHPESAASWKPLGGQTDFANEAEVTIGTEAAKAIAPITLREELMRVFGVSFKQLLNGEGSTSHSNGITDINKLVALDASGKIDLSLLSIDGFTFLGIANFAHEPPDPTSVKFPQERIPIEYHAGDVYFHSGATNVAPDHSWNFGSSVIHVAVADMALFDGEYWNHLDTSADLSAAVLKAGNNQMVKNSRLTWANNDLAEIIIDGTDTKNSVIEKVTLNNSYVSNSVIHGGTF